LAQSSTAPSARIVDRIDENQLTVLHGNTHPAAVAKNDMGRVAPDLRMTDMILVLSRSAEQQAAFEAFVASQYDQNSANYHHWLSPLEVGQKFGPAPSDIAAISGWLTGHGFQVDQVSNDRMSIRFSGTAAQVESALHTEIHNLTVKGEAHIANMSDPQIPTALSQVVVGVKALHNFFPRPMHRLGSAVTRDSASGKWQRPTTAAASASDSGAKANVSPQQAQVKVRPQFGISVPASGSNSAYLVEDVTPYDFATIYNVLPLWQAGTPINGAGQSIAIAGTSAIVPGDVATFRSTFGLPANTPTVVSGNGTTPTVCTATTTSGAACTIDDLIENSLDVEWSGAVAPAASITLVTSAAKSTTDDTLYDSESYIVNNKLAPIMNVSYGECELGQGTAGNVEYYNLWQTAASEGIAVFVAAGDSGSAGCDNSSSTPSASEFGLAVSGIASTPYNTSVGGTDFNWCSLTANECTASPYWNSTNASNGSSAKGYVPEVPWNDTCASPAALGFIEELATSLSISNVNDAETACNFMASTTIRQEVNYYDGFDPGIFVQAVGGSGGASGCVVNNGSTVSSCVSTTTSTGSLYGSIPLTNDGWQKPAWQANVTGIPSDGVRDQPDVSFFASDGFLSSSAYLICVSDVTACTYSTSVEPTMEEVGGTSVASPVMAGVMALINQKTGAPQGSPNAQLYQLAAKQNYSSCNAANGSPASTCYFNDITTGTNAMPCDDAFFGGLSPNCTVVHSADKGGIGILSGSSATTGYDMATGLGSLNVANVVNAWASDAGTGTATETLGLSASTITVNQPVTVTVTLAGSGSLGTPTGNVFLTGGGYTGSQALTAGVATFNIPANGLTAGRDTLTANYGGDANYAAVSQTTSVLVNVMTPTVTVTAPASGNFSNALSVTATVTGPTGSTAVPTGTVSISSGSYSSGAATLVNGAYTFSIPADTLAVNTDTLTVMYSGDTNYAGATGTTTVQIVTTTTLTPTLTVTPASTSVDTGQTLGVTVTAGGAGGTPSGTITLTAGSYTSTATSLTNGMASFTVPADSLNAGTATLKATYSGDSVYTAATATGSVAVTASAYSLVLTPASGSVAPGSTATSTITLTSTTNYTGTVTLGCEVTASPTNASSLPICSVASTLTMNGGTLSGSGVALTVTTTAASSELAWPKFGGKHSGKSGGWLGAGGGAVLAFLIFLGVPARRRKWFSMLGVLAVMVALGSIGGCGGGSGSTSITGTSGTTAGAYTLTITGTGSDPSATQATTTFNLTVN
jgi:hypothetical protein